MMVSFPDFSYGIETVTNIDLVNSASSLMWNNVFGGVRFNCNVKATIAQAIYIHDPGPLDSNIA